MTVVGGSVEATRCEGDVDIVWILFWGVDGQNSSALLFGADVSPEDSTEEGFGFEFHSLLECRFSFGCRASSNGNRVELFSVCFLIVGFDILSWNEHWSEYR